MNYKKQTVLRDFIYIVNMTKPETNRHLEIHEKTLEEQTFVGASRTCLINLLMSFILKLLEVYFF